MAFELPTLPFPIDPASKAPYIASPDVSGKYTVASGQWFKSASGLWVPVSAADPLPSTDAETQSRIGAKTDVAVTNPELSASEIALLKGLLKQLQGAGSGAVPTTLTGRYVQEPQEIISSQSVAAGATLYAPTGSRPKILGFTDLGIYVTCDQNYDITIYGQATQSVAANSAGTITNQPIAVERYHRLTSYIGGANYFSIGIKNLGAVAATISVKWSGCI